MHLLIMRHGKAPFSSNDYDRILSPAGCRGVRKIARCVRKKVAKLDRILCSPLRRTVQTAEIINKLSYPTVPLELCDDLAPGASCEVIADKLNTMQEDGLMLVSHQPFVGKMTHYLTGELLSIREATVACIKLKNFGLYSGELRWVVES